MLTVRIFQYFTLPLLVQWTPSDFHQTLPFPMDSVDSPSESVGHDWIPLLVQPKSSESPLKPPKSKKWLDWLEFCVCWTSAGLPLDFHWISDGLRQKPVIFAKFSFHWTSAGLPPDFRWTSKQKRCKRVVSGNCSHSLLLL